MARGLDAQPSFCNRESRATVRPIRSRSWRCWSVSMFSNRGSERNPRASVRSGAYGFAEGHGARQAFLAFRGVDVFAEDRHAGARAANRRRLRRDEVDGVLDRRVLPVADVVRLVAAGDPHRLGVSDRLDHERVRSRRAFLENDGFDRVAAAESRRCSRCIRPCRMRAAQQSRRRRRTLPSARSSGRRRRRHPGRPRGRGSDG